MEKWLEEILGVGLVPYVATSEYLLGHFDLGVFGGREIVRLMEDPAHRDFHEAYLVSNSLAFGNPNLKMPNWVYIDCALMQTAVVGFAVPVAAAPDTLLVHYERDPSVNLAALDYIPVSGQIAALGLDGATLTGYSLFSLRRQLGTMNLSDLAARTKYAALKAYRAEERESFLGISQYDNNALKIHARFGEKMYIDRATVPLHPLRDMSFTYRMKIALDPVRIFGDGAGEGDAPHDFLLRADDLAAKESIQRDRARGRKFHIVSPVHIKKEDGLYLPVKTED